MEELPTLFQFTDVFNLMVCLYAAMSIESGALGLLVSAQPFSIFETMEFCLACPCLNAFLLTSVLDLTELPATHFLPCDPCGFLFIFENEKLLKYMTSGIEHFFPISNSVYAHPEDLCVCSYTYIHICE